MLRLMIAGLILLAGCAGQAVTRAEPIPAGPVTPASCHADQYQNFVGQPELALQSTSLTLPGNVRIYQVGSPIPDGVTPGRLNFIFDSRRIITKVACG